MPTLCCQRASGYLVILKMMIWGELSCQMVCFYGVAEYAILHWT